MDVDTATALLCAMVVIIAATFTVIGLFARLLAREETDPEAAAADPPEEDPQAPGGDGVA